MSDDEFDNIPDDFDGVEGIDWAELLSGSQNTHTPPSSSLPPSPTNRSPSAQPSTDHACDDDEIDSAFLAELDILERNISQTEEPGPSRTPTAPTTTPNAHLNRSIATSTREHVASAPVRTLPSPRVLPPQSNLGTTAHISRSPQASSVPPGYIKPYKDYDVYMLKDTPDVSRHVDTFQIGCYTGCIINEALTHDISIIHICHLDQTTRFNAAKVYNMKNCTEPLARTGPSKEDGYLVQANGREGYWITFPGTGNVLEYTPPAIWPLPVPLNLCLGITHEYHIAESARLVREIPDNILTRPPVANKEALPAFLRNLVTEPKGSKHRRRVR